VQEGALIKDTLYILKTPTPYIPCITWELHTGCLARKQAHKGKGELSRSAYHLAFLERESKSGAHAYQMVWQLPCC